MRINGNDYEIRSKAIGESARAINRIVVHGSRFHADDVFCAAMSLMCYPDAEVLRVNSVPEEYLSDEKTIVADIGFGKYDHHQLDAEIREGGNRYAACGLLFRDLKIKLFSGNRAAADMFEKAYIIPIEITDNGGRENPLSRAIAAFNPAWDSDKNSDEAFAEAVGFVQEIIGREIDRKESEEKAAEIVRAALKKSDGKVVVLPENIPWRDTLVESSAIYVIYPSARGGHNLQAVPVTYGDRKAKQDLPAEWIENRPEGCTFVHPGLFIAGFETGVLAEKAANEIFHQ